MIVLVSMREVENSGYPERRDAISHDWMRLFNQYDIVPVLVPNALDDVTAYFSLGARGVLFTGGDDLGDKDAPALRDLNEDRLLSMAVQRDLPVLGVCRGLQMINQHFGGEIVRSLPEPHVGEHEIIFADGARVRVNSFHNQGVMREGLAPSLTPFAASAGDVIEGVRHKSHRILAIQWHPERPSPSTSLDRSILTEWLSQCG